MGESQPEAQVNGLAGSRMTALQSNSIAATFRSVSAMQQMYKDFSSYYRA